MAGKHEFMGCASAGAVLSPYVVCRYQCLQRREIVMYLYTSRALDAELLGHDSEAHGMVTRNIECWQRICNAVMNDLFWKGLATVKDEQFLWHHARCTKNGEIVCKSHSTDL